MDECRGQCIVFDAALNPRWKIRVGGPKDQSNRQSVNRLQATIFKVTAVRLYRRYLCLLFTADRGIGHDVSAGASFYHPRGPRGLRFIAYAMAGLVICLHGFG